MPLRRTREERLRACVRDAVAVRHAATRSGNAQAKAEALAGVRVKRKRVAYARVGGQQTKGECVGKRCAARQLAVESPPRRQAWGRWCSSVALWREIRPILILRCAKAATQNSSGKA